MRERRIMVIISVFQTEDAGSIPVARSTASPRLRSTSTALYKLNFK